MKYDRKPGIYYGNDFIGKEEETKVAEVIEKQSIFRYYGKDIDYRTDEFESKLSDFLSTSKTLCTSSGTASLKCALKALNIGINDEVILPAYGFIATANAIISCNAIPVFCDIDDSMNIDADKIEQFITNNTKAIICVHIGGEPCNLEKIMKIAKKNNIKVIEDTAQAFGGKYKGEYLGSIGDVGCFSFQANKILSTGEGGCLTSKNDKLIELARIYHDQGGVRVNNSFPQWDDLRCIFGENYRMSEITAAIGIEQLKKIPDILNKLRQNKKSIMEGLCDLDIQFRKSWDLEGDCASNIVFYIFDKERREKVLDDLSCIYAHKNYNKAVYENLLFQEMDKKMSMYCFNKNIKVISNLNNCYNAQRLSKAAIWIPVGARYTREDIEYVVYKIRVSFKK